MNSFYRWAIESGFVEQNPILQRPARDRRWHRHGEAALTPAEAPKDGHREDLAWLPPALYRRWRDVGVRGYLPTGLPDRSFRGGNAARNATFCDLMVRTGLRLTEQASLTLFEIPDIDTHRAYSPTRLPSAIDMYMPDGGAAGLPKGRARERLHEAIAQLREPPGVWSARELAERLASSRVTARRYLQILRRGRHGRAFPAVQRRRASRGGVPVRTHRGRC